MRDYHYPSAQGDGDHGDHGDHVPRNLPQQPEYTTDMPTHDLKNEDDDQPTDRVDD